MGDETANVMNLDLNLHPFASPDNEESGSVPNESVSLEDWIGGRFNRIRETLRLRARQRWQSLLRQVSVPPESRNLALDLMVDSGNAGDVRFQTGNDNISSEERNVEVIKTCENNPTHVESEALGKKEDEGKGNGEEGSVFDCNICLDLAREPVVTCCGHLFCWSCLYRWLHVHSDANECPVCKGEVTTKNLTPIYGRGNNTCKPEEDLSLKTPLRPNARRIESWRQTVQRNAFSFPMEQTFRQLGSRFDFSRDTVQVQPQSNIDNIQISPERNNSFLQRFLTSRGMRTEHNTLASLDDIIDVGSIQVNPNNPDRGESHQFPTVLLRRPHTHRAASIAFLTSELTSRQRLLESYLLRERPVERNPEQRPPVDDRDSMSSIAAVIQSESQIIDTAVEIDSTVAISTSTSRRRNDASRILDVDSGDSRAHRRRRLS
ncbi:Ubiquitin--protein ligase [Bertholletia excelsa]